MLSRSARFILSRNYRGRIAPSVESKGISLLDLQSDSIQSVETNDLRDLINTSIDQLGSIGGSSQAIKMTSTNGDLRMSVNTSPTLNLLVSQFNLDLNKMITMYGEEGLQHLDEMDIVTMAERIRELMVIFDIQDSSERVRNIFFCF